MTRAAIAALLAVCGVSCNRLDQSRAKATANRLESRHLADLRRVADDLEKSCATAVGSPASGTSLDADPAVAEVEVVCHEVLHGTTRLRGTPLRREASYFEIGVGKNADAAFNPIDAEETVKVPSVILPNANDLCIHRRKVEICVAYRD